MIKSDDGYNAAMSIENAVKLIDQHIEQLQQARVVLESMSAATSSKKYGRKTAALAQAAQPKRKRNLSPESRARIVEAVKRRWAKAKKTAK
jgi:hypothetical protein